MQVDIWIEVHDSNIIHDLFGVEPSEYNKIYREKQKKIVSEGISIQYKSNNCCDAENIPTWLIITAEIVGKDIVLPALVGILSSYIYDKLKDRKNESLMINNQTIEINAKKIEQLIMINLNVNVNEKEDKEKKRNW